jgi:hypothetical protein
MLLRRQNKDTILVTERGCELLSDYLDTDSPLIVSAVLHSQEHTA